MTVVVYGEPNLVDLSTKGLPYVSYDPPSITSVATHGTPPANGPLATATSPNASNATPAPTATPTAAPTAAPTMPSLCFGTACHGTPGNFLEVAATGLPVSPAVRETWDNFYKGAPPAVEVRIGT